MNTQNKTPYSAWISKDLEAIADNLERLAKWARELANSDDKTKLDTHYYVRKRFARKTEEFAVFCGRGQQDFKNLSTKLDIQNFLLAESPVMSVDLVAEKGLPTS